MPRILIVDDETAILGLLSGTFRKAGYEVNTVTSGKLALDISETTSFDAVLSDVTMPGIDSHQTVSRIRARMPNVVAVLISGFHMACTRECGVAPRHCTWLQKPFRPAVAITAVRQALTVREGKSKLIQPDLKDGSEPPDH
jgi:DNA-binding NtrC family response regulator